MDGVYIRFQGHYKDTPVPVKILFCSTCLFHITISNNIVGVLMYCVAALKDRGPHVRTFAKVISAMANPQIAHAVKLQFTSYLRHLQVIIR